MEILHELIAFFTVYGYIAVFLVLIACGFGIPIPEDITLVAGGVICGLAASMDVHLMVVVSLLGVIVGDGTMFMLGKLLGPRVKNVPLVKNVFTEKRYQQMQEKVHKYGNRILFVARFLPGLRAPIFVTAGISRRVSYWKFLVMDGGAALISVPLWVYAGYYFAHDLDDLLHWVKQSETFIISILAIIFIIWLIVSVVKKNKTKSN
ncbi:DedA family protein [Aquella oligotrophica]|uniref:DedA family protein n=1 Tax=Aquella oligotrophica TaxID=2067065 RepID=UPI001C99A48A|nr:DedA family protein [Aquella oligotrophica]